MTGTELSALVDRVKALEAAIEQLQPCPEIATTLTAVTEEPEIRVRIAHTHTKADGWRCNETTVEWTGRGLPEWITIARQLSHAANVGRDEAEIRNATVSDTGAPS